MMGASGGNKDTEPSEITLHHCFLLFCSIYDIHET